MDITWIKHHDTKFSARHRRGVADFLEFVKAHLGDHNVLCPCSDCLNNEPPTTQRQVHDHLHLHKMSVSYTNWIYHGELHGAPGIITDNIDPPEDDRPRT